MGPGTHGEGFLYVNVANGRMNYKEGDEKKQADFFDGVLIGIELFEDTYEEKPVSKVALTISYGEKRAKLKFTLESWYSIGFFSRISAVDVLKPFRLGVMPSDKNEKISFCWMRQGENKIPADKSIPLPEKKKMGKSDMTDWTKFDQYVDKVIADLQQKLAQQTGEKSEDLPF